MLTVGELIEQLKQYDPATLIVVPDPGASAEITDLRRRRDEVLYYISQIDNPNPQTLWHIRNILTGDDSIYGVPDGH